MSLSTLFHSTLPTFLRMLLLRPLHHCFFVLCSAVFPLRHPTPHPFGKSIACTFLSRKAVSGLYTSASIVFLPPLRLQSRPSSCMPIFPIDYPDLRPRLPPPLPTHPYMVAPRPHTPRCFNDGIDYIRFASLSLRQPTNNRNSVASKNSSLAL